MPVLRIRSISDEQRGARRQHERSAVSESAQPSTEVNWRAIDTLSNPCYQSASTDPSPSATKTGSNSAHTRRSPVACSLTRSPPSCATTQEQQRRDSEWKQSEHTNQLQVQAGQEQERLLTERESSAPRTGPAPPRHRRMRDAGPATAPSTDLFFTASSTCCSLSYLTFYHAREDRPETENY
jgi:hypothetical protein